MIFINYRKHDTQPTVDHLAERLKAAFGAEHVFKDDADLQGGDVWPDRLKAELARAKVLVAVIGPNWLKSYDEHGRRRIDDPADWVREEICTALRDGKTVLVILADGAPTLARPALPSGCELEKLPDIQKVELRKGPGRDADLTSLTQRLADLTGLPARSAAVQAAAAEMTPLPQAPTVFFGRDDKLAELRAMVVPADTSRPLPKVPITGIGGMGKSTLTAALLHDPAVVERYADRRHFAKLDGADGLPLLLEKLAGALGVPLGAGLANRVVAAAGADGPRLLVLDNLETPLQDEAQQPDVLEFLEQLAAVSTLAVVASLRPGCPLGAGWKRPLELLPYDLEAARATFHARSSEVYLGDPDLDGLLKELDGWPIAVTVLARRAGDYPRAKDLAAAWRERHSALLVPGSSRRDVDLGACVGLSLAHPKMNDGARRLLGLLALSPDGIDQDDMNQLLPGIGNRAAATLRAVGGLTTNEYYRLRDRDRPRMWMPAPLRDYLGTRFPVSADDRKQWIRLYCRRGEKLGNLIGNKDSARLVQRFRAELGNIQDAIRIGLTANASIEACQGAAGLGQFGYLTNVDVRSILRHAADVALRLHNGGVIAADNLLNLGKIALSRSNLTEAQSAADEALAGYRRFKVVAGEAVCIRLLADLAYCRSDHATARAHLAKALAMSREGHDPNGVANCAYMMSEIALDRREYTDALRSVQEAQAIYRKVESLHGEANCILTYGDIALARNELGEAARHYTLAIPMSQEVGESSNPAYCCLGLGDVYLREHRLDEAEEQYRQARRIFEQIDPARGIGNCRRSQGDLALARGQAHAAREHYRAALASYERFGGRQWIGQMHQRLARVATDPAERAEHVRLARESWKPLDLPPEFLKELDGEFGPEPAAT